MVQEHDHDSYSVVVVKITTKYCVAWCQIFPVRRFVAEVVSPADAAGITGVNY